MTADPRKPSTSMVLVPRRASAAAASAMSAASPPGTKLGTTEHSGTCSVGEGKGEGEGEGEDEG